MSNDPMMNTQMDGKLVDSLLQVNKISYRMPPQIAIATKAHHTIQYPQQNAYSNGNTMVWDLQSGSSFVDPACSYLRLRVVPSDGAHCFGAGSACNLFERIVIRTKTGKELTRTENAGLLCRHMQRYEKSENWLKTVGKSQGFTTRKEVGTVNVYADAVPAVGKLFVIPLQDIFTCFNPVNGALLPAQMCSGMRIEIRLADPDDAFCSVDQAAPAGLLSYTIDRPEIHLKEYTLNDAFQRKVTEMANQGLNLLYKEHYNTIVAQNTNVINYDIKKAVSKALRNTVITRLSADLSAGGADRVCSAPYNYEKIQSQIGADYFPNQPLQVDGPLDADNVNESYYFALEEQNKLESWDPTSVNPDQFLGSANTGAVGDVFNNGACIFNYCKSNVSSLAGYTVSNSRSAIINLRQEGVAQSVRVDTYLCYLRLAKVMNTNTLVLD